jgi:hypothetical protein
MGEGCEAELELGPSRCVLQRVGAMVRLLERVADARPIALHICYAARKLEVPRVMKSPRWLSIPLSLAMANALAQQTPNPPPVQAPPGIEEPGVASKPGPTPSNETTAAQKASESSSLPAEVQAAAEATELPVVTVRQQGSETIEEYRKRGKLYFVRVLTPGAPPKFYVDDPAAIPPDIMRQLSQPSGVVQPVYFKLAEWSRP